MFTTLSIADTIKDSVLKHFSTGVTAGQMLMSLLVSFLMGLLILVIYRVTFRGVLFSKGFAFSLVNCCYAQNATHGNGYNAENSHNLLTFYKKYDNLNLDLKRS